MSRCHSSETPRPWEPQPLQLPIEAPQRRRPAREDKKSEPDKEDDQTGSHVIVIDLG